MLFRSVLSYATTSDIEVPHPVGLEYMPFQKVGIEYGVRHQHVLIADDMGCVSGDTIVTLNRAGKSFKMSISKIFKRFNHLETNKRWMWNSGIPTTIRCLYNNEFRSMPLEKVLYSGEKDCLEIELEDGKSLVCTPDHEILTDDGYIRAEHLNTKSTIITNGIPICPSCGSSKNLATYKYAKFRGYCKTCIYRKKRELNRINEQVSLDNRGYLHYDWLRYHPYSYQGRVLAHRIVFEASLNSLTTQQWLDILAEGINLHQYKFLTPDQLIHHKDGNKTNNVLTNLELTNIVGHSITHKTYNHFTIFKPKQTKVSSIKRTGMKNVYDLKVPMADNFVANGIVVHNCGKTIEAIGITNILTPSCVLIICPSTPKINWLREYRKWSIYNKSIAITKDEWVDADVVIINYDKLEKFSGISDLVLDEIYIEFFKSEYESGSHRKFVNREFKLFNEITKIEVLKEIIDKLSRLEKRYEKNKDNQLLLEEIE